MDHGITALPVHDALMVAASRADRAEALINESTQQAFGYTLPLEQK